MLRAVLMGVGMVFWFAAIAVLPLGDAIALHFTLPLFLIVFAAIILREKIDAPRWIATAAGFAGVLVILRPGIHVVDIGAWAQITAAPLFAISFLISKKLTERESSMAIVAALSVFVTLTLLPGALLVWRTPTMEEIVWLTLTAVCATAGHFTLTQAFRAADITALQPVLFLQLVWATLLGLIVFGEQPDLWTWVGAGIIVASATYIAHREAVISGKARDKAAAL
jgi:drug/metabolite transporter (DMT)-like permease